MRPCRRGQGRLEFGDLAWDVAAVEVGGGIETGRREFGQVAIEAAQRKVFRQTGSRCGRGGAHCGEIAPPVGRHEGDADAGFRALRIPMPREPVPIVAAGGRRVAQHLVGWERRAKLHGHPQRFRRAVPARRRCDGVSVADESALLGQHLAVVYTQRGAAFQRHGDRQRVGDDWTTIDTGGKRLQACQIDRLVVQCDIEDLRERALGRVGGRPVPWA